MVEKPQPAAASSENIKLYSLPGCTYCSQIKDYLQSQGLSFQEINLETDQAGQSFMEERGYTALPVTIIGTHEISGFRLDKIKEILNRL
ncbi:glutaredoxin family protein [Lacrimispora sp.]|uniref:glutaredoxin family protein n=1 Tax=Lacrimispora sp. TaxID=2719234 RepID=UPI003FA55E70